jgi:hypothetical protein
VALTTQPHHLGHPRTQVNLSQTSGTYNNMCPRDTLPTGQQGGAADVVAWQLLDTRAAKLQQKLHCTRTAHDACCAHAAGLQLHARPFIRRGPPGCCCLTVRSHLLPMSMMVMFGFACCRASSSQLARWLNVSRLQSSTSAQPWAAAGVQGLPAAAVTLSAPRDVVNQQCSSCTAVV